VVTLLTTFYHFWSLLVIAGVDGRVLACGDIPNNAAHPNVMDTFGHYMDHFWSLLVIAGVEGQDPPTTPPTPTLDTLLVTILITFGHFWSSQVWKGGRWHAVISPNNAAHPDTRHFWSLY
jgi:hypothetical protein